MRYLPIAAYLGSDRDNNFKLLRAIAASLVIFGHSHSISLGPSAPGQAFPGLPISYGGFAVNVFFTLSGFLIAKSYLDRHRPLAFIRARLLRIYPAAVVAILFTVYVVGLAFTTLPARTYVTHPEVDSYLSRNLPLVFSPIRSTLPGVFASNATPYGVNDPLWTLPYEMWMYVITLVVGVAGLLGHRRRFNIAVVALGLTYVAAAVWSPATIEGPLIGQFWRLGFFFLAGSVAYVNRDRVPLTPVAVVAGIAVAAICRGTSWFMPIVDVTIAYGVLVLALVPGGVLRRYNMLGDYSYGLYVFGFPIQQGLAAIVPGIRPLPLFGTSMAVALAIAAASWRFIEAPALRLKTR